MNAASVSFREQSGAQQAVTAGGGFAASGSEDVLFDRVRSSALARFSSAPFHKVGMRAIAREAGTGMAGLYDIAASKERLLQVCLAPDFEARANRVAEASRREVSCRSRLRACIEALIAFELERPDFARTIRLHAPPLLVRAANDGGGLERSFTELLRRGVREGSIRTDLPMETLVAMIQALTDGMLARWTAAASDGGPSAGTDDARARADRLFALLWPAVCSD